MTPSKFESLLENQRALALLSIRVLVAFVFLWHGLPKALDFPMAMDKFIAIGLPGFLGPITGWVEVIASAMLIVGFMTREAAIVLAIVILGALITVQFPGGMSAALERDLLILVASFALAAFGPGKYAFKK